MIFQLDLPHVFRPGSSDEDNAMALEAMLEALIAANMVFLKRNPRTPRLYKSGVRYARTTVWLSIPSLYSLGRGDCKSLTAALVAEERMAGRQAKPVFRPIFNKKKGMNDFHILVQTPYGYEDPSRKLGMDQYFAQQRVTAYPR